MAACDSASQDVKSERGREGEESREKDIYIERASSW